VVGGGGLPKGGEVVCWVGADGACYVFALFQGEFPGGFPGGLPGGLPGGFPDGGAYVAGFFQGAPFMLFVYILFLYSYILCKIC
jgi:hypothetical protein